VYLADQKLAVDVSVRNVASDTEVSLAAYQALRSPRQMDEGLLLRVLKGISSRNYESCAQAIPEAFGLSDSAVSRCPPLISKRKTKFSLYLGLPISIR